MRKISFYVMGICCAALIATACARHNAKTCCTVDANKGYINGSANQAVAVKEEAPAVKTVEVIKEAPAVKVAPVVVAVPVAAVVEVPTVPAAAAAVSAPVVAVAPVGVTYSFGDFKSSTLTTKAWQALAANDTDAVFVYTTKCIDMYGAQAAKMQAGLTDYPAGDNDKIFSYWALNDVATSLYIQAEAYRKAKQMDKAKATYERIINEFSYGQTYDVNNKTFWKPAVAAKDGLYMIEKNLDLDFGNMTSNYIVSKMWVSFAKHNLEEVIAYDMKIESLYGQEAKNMQKSLKDFPAMPAENVHSYWALNDVGTAAFILGEAYRADGKNTEAIAAYTKVSEDYGFAQCWDPQGWFWKPADAAKQKVTELSAAK